MATKVYTSRDMQHNPVLSFMFENLGAAPANAQPGWAYYDTVLGAVGICISASGGGQWYYAKVDPNAFTNGSIPLAKLATDPLARANHTGTQAAATIVDLATVVQAYRLDQFAAPTSALNAGAQRITNGADPTGNSDFTTMQWVTAAIAAKVNGLDWKNSVRVNATSNINIASAPAAIDGITLTTGDRVLLSGQSTGSQNGIYDYAGSGNAMTRSADANSSATVTANLAVAIEEGTSADTYWQITTNAPITLGTTALTFAQFGTGTAYTAQSPITLVGSQFQLGTVPVAKGGTGATDAAGARTALGVPQKGFAADIPALTAGVATQIAHGLGTSDLTVQTFLKSTGQTVEFDIQRDATNITITSAQAISAALYRVVATPVA